MRIRVTVRDDLLKVVQSESQNASISESVNYALADWARRLRVDKIKAMAGKLHFDGKLTGLRRLEVKKAGRFNTSALREIGS